MKSPVEFAREFLGEARHFTAAGVHIKGQADDKQLGLPFINQPFNFRPIWNTVGRFDDSDRGRGLCENRQGQDPDLRRLLAQ